MARRSHNFDSGTNGTTITIGNSGAGGQTAFDFINIGTGGDVTYDTTHAHSGSQSMHVVSGASQVAYVQYGGTSGNLASENTATDFWVYMTAIPAADVTLMYAANTGGARQAQVGLLTNGRLRMRTEGATWLWTATDPLPTNTWVQIRFYSRNQGAGASYTKVAAYNGATLLEEYTTSTSNRSSPIAGLAVGEYGTSFTTTSYWIDDFAVETEATGYIDETAAVVNGVVNKQVTIDATSSTGTITNWAISQISGPAGTATDISPGVWSVPEPIGEAAVWRVTITVGGNDYTGDFTVDPATGGGGESTPVVLLYRDAGVWV